MKIIENYFDSEVTSQTEWRESQLIDLYMAMFLASFPVTTYREYNHHNFLHFVL